MTTLARTSPYLGPRPFGDDDHDRARFFARDAEADEIVALILGHPLTVVYAQSGAGKTSIFNAAVLPRLRNEGFTALPLTRVSGGIPEDLNPAQVLNPYILNVITGLAPDARVSDLASRSLADYLADGAGDGKARVLVVDQFEEIFTQATARGQEDRDKFFSELANAIAGDSLLRVVLVLREEYIAQLEPYARILPEKLRIRFRLERLDFQGALTAVTEPLAGTGCRYDIGVAERLVGELAKIRSVSLSGQSLEVSGGYVEPVQLQVACLGLWDALPPDAAVITSSHLDEFGDVDEALGRFYDSVVATVVEEGFDERQVREWFSDTLITPLGTRGTVYRGDTTGGLPNEAVDLLEAHHLVRAEFRSGARWCELTHDRLVEPIRKQNELWEKRLYNENPLAAGAVIWERLDRDRGSLLGGRQLDEARQYADSPTNSLTELEEDFLEASLEAQGRRRRKRALYLGALVAAVAVALFAIWQWGQTADARNVAEEAKLDAEVAQLDAVSAQLEAESALGVAEAAAAAEEEARLEAEAAAAAEEEARLDAEAALRTSRARLDLLNRIAQDPNTLGGSVEANETATHAITVPSGRDFLVASVVTVFADEIASGVQGDEESATRAAMQVTLIEFEAGRSVSMSQTCYCASVSGPASGLWVIEVSSPVAVTYEIGLSFDQPLAILDLPPDEKVPGSIDNLSDVDHWRFNGEQGQIVTVEVTPTQGSVLQAIVEVLDPAGNPIGFGSSGAGQNTAVVVELPYDDEYVVIVQTIDFTGAYEISRSEFERSVVDQGRLTIGDTTTGIIEKPGETHIWRFESLAGTPFIIQLVGAAVVDPGFGFVVELEDPDGIIIGVQEAAPLIVTNPTDGTYLIRISGSNFSVTGPYELEALELPIVNRGDLALGDTRSGSIDEAGQRDHWRFVGFAGEIITIDVVASPGSFLDTFVSFLDSSGSVVAEDDDGGVDFNSRLTVTLPEDGEYVIEIRGFDSFSLGAYEVSLT